MKRMLYFDGRSAKQVVADGESLLVRSNGRANQRYPLRYLSALELRGKGMWSVEAIQLLLGAEIPIVFRNGEGAVVGYAHGVSPNASRLADRLSESILLEGFRSEYETWRRAVERRLLLRALRHLRIELVDLRRHQVAAAMDALISRQYPRLEGKRWLDGYAGLLVGESSRYLLQSGFDGRFLAEGAGRLDLAQDLAWMGLWRELSSFFAICSRASHFGGSKMCLLNEQRRLRELSRSELDAFWGSILMQLSDWMAMSGL